MKASEKQVRYALHLMDAGGYSTRYMNARHKELGASMRERSGSVADWLGSMTPPQISRLIDSLKK